MGASIRLPTRWICYLECKEENGKMWIGVWFKLDKEGATSYSKVISKLAALEIGSFFNAVESDLLDWLTIVSWGWSRVIPQLEESTELLPLNADGSLSVEVEMVLVNLEAVITPTCTLSLDSLELEFKAKFRDTFEKDLKNMINKPGVPSSAPMTVKVISSDDKEILASSGILAARSPVFLSMFQSQMSEVQEGVIKVDDVCGPALQALLSFVHTGSLPANWKEPEIVKDFTYAAHKYMLEEMVEFLDQGLRMVVCAPKNCIQLVELAKKLDMKTAEKELTRVLRDRMKDASLDEMRQLFDDRDRN